MPQSGVSPFVTIVRTRPSALNTSARFHRIFSQSSLFRCVRLSYERDRRALTRLRTNDLHSYRRLLRHAVCFGRRLWPGGVRARALRVASRRIASRPARPRARSASSRPACQPGRAGRGRLEVPRALVEGDAPRSARNSGSRRSRPRRSKNSFRTTRPELNKLDDDLQRRENMLSELIKDDSPEAMIEQQIDQVESTRGAHEQDASADALSHAPGADGAAARRSSKCCTRSGSRSRSRRSSSVSSSDQQRSRRPNQNGRSRTASHARSATGTSGDCSNGTLGRER